MTYVQNHWDWEYMTDPDETEYGPTLRRYQVPGGWVYQIRGAMVFVADEEAKNWHREDAPCQKNNEGMRSHYNSNGYTCNE